MNCKNCGREFIPHGHRRLFCCKECCHQFHGSGETKKPKKIYVKSLLNEKLKELNSSGTSYSDWQKRDTLEKYGKIDLSLH